MDNKGFEEDGSPPVGSAKMRRFSRADDDERFKNGYIATLIHLMKGNLGAGAFAMGSTVKNGGLLLGTVLTVFLGFVCVYNNHTLIRSAEHICAKKKLRSDPSFTDTIVLSFENGPSSFRKMSSAVRLTMKVLIIFTQLAFCCVYVKTVADTFRRIMISHDIEHSSTVYMAIIYIPVLLNCYIRTLKFLTPFSLLSNACLLCGVVFTVYLSATDLPDISSRPLVTPSWQTIPIMFGMVVYAFEAIALYIPLKNSMKQPKQFSSTFGVLNVGMVIYMTILLILGFLGYLKYGESVESSLVLNLPQGNAFSQAVQIEIAIGILFSYALQFYVVLDLVWVEIQNAWGPFKSPVLLEMHLRTILVTFTFLVAAVVPKLDLFISFIGAVSSTCLALFFPAMSDIALRTSCDEETRLRSRNQSLRFIMDGITILVAFIAFAFGGYYSVKAIVDAFFNNPDDVKINLSPDSVA